MYSVWQAVNHTLNLQAQILILVMSAGEPPGWSGVSASPGRSSNGQEISRVPGLHDHITGTCAPTSRTCRSGSPSSNPNTLKTSDIIKYFPHERIHRITILQLFADKRMTVSFSYFMSSSSKTPKREQHTCKSLSSSIFIRTGGWRCVVPFV